jgi:hypothetical protein
MCLPTIAASAQPSGHQAIVPHGCENMEGGYPLAATQNNTKRTYTDSMHIIYKRDDCLDSIRVRLREISS